MIADIPTLRNTPSGLKRRCPDCGSLLLLEPVYGDGYWWSCLICGLHKPADGIVPSRATGPSTRSADSKPRTARLASTRR